MTVDDRAGIARHVEARLPATLMSGDRLFPITVTNISEAGFAGEGVALDGLDEEVLLEMTLPPVGDGTWSPRAAAAQSRAAPPCHLRVRARLGERAPSERGLPQVQALEGVFEAMTDACRTLIQRWMARMSAAGQPITKGIAPRWPTQP